MIGLGILEFGLLFAGGAYIYSLCHKKSNIQYIELDQNQFQRLQNTLVTNNVLPTYMLVNNNQNLDMIPPAYEDSNLRQALQQSTQNPDQPATLEVTTQSDTPPYSLNIQDTQHNNDTNQVYLPASNLYSSISI